MPLFLRRFGRRGLRRRRRPVDGHHRLRGGGRSVGSGVDRGRLSGTGRFARTGVARDGARRDAAIERGRSGRCECRGLDTVARGSAGARDRETAEDERCSRQSCAERKRSDALVDPIGQIDPTEGTGHVGGANMTRACGTRRKGHESEANSFSSDDAPRRGVSFVAPKARGIFGSKDWAWRFVWSERSSKRARTLVVERTRREGS